MIESYNFEQSFFHYFDLISVNHDFLLAIFDLLDYIPIAKYFENLLPHSLISALSLLLFLVSLNLYPQAFISLITYNIENQAFNIHLQIFLSG